MNGPKFLSIVIIIALSFLSACSKHQDSKEKVLTVIAASDIKGFDPIMSSDVGSAAQIAKIYEGLLSYHWLKIPYELIPNLAEEMPVISADGMTYTFKIKKGVHFQDDIAFPNGKGREMEAADFVYSIKRLADTKNQATGWWILDGKIKGLNEWRNKYQTQPSANYDEEVAGIKAIDKYTLQFQLSKPFPQFLYSLAMPYTFVVPKEAVTKYGPEFINHPVGTGPYVLPVFDQGKRVVFTKNPTFREKFYPSEASPEYKHFLGDAGKKLPLIDKIIVNVMVESQPAWLKFNKGEIDYLNIPKDNFSSTIVGNKLSQEMLDKGMSLTIMPSLDVYYIGFNFDYKIFQNVNLRRAMSLAYDVKTANRLFYNDTGFPAQSVAPPGLAGNVPSFKNEWKGPNIELAKKTLALAGYPEGKGLPEITLDTMSSTTARQKAEFFQAQMEKIGIKIKVVMNLNPELQAKIKKRAVQMIDYGWIGDYPDTENFLQIFYGPNSAPGANSANYNNPQFNKDFEVAVKMQHSPKRTELYEKLNQYLANEAVAIFTVHTQSYMLQQKWVKNYHDSDFIFDYHQYMNIDQSQKMDYLKKF
ncbi:ABC transporter substrate-binding protein [Bacteriovorax sp. PP10]|uniref:ABC transporter substrate-binding protein n=1 Tax=Bacteriovorax antarcticus TaxID=3088717 RepID=A0ABU5VW08_9BACT|nr:ABC transporter substrate-binding protein [Bacteriovorax sp. PP10]MEA9357231.1 ABC transporter substrate-binding protein [Bacteriovorax sp. PP10]